MTMKPHRAAFVSAAAQLYALRAASDASAGRRALLDVKRRFAVEKRDAEGARRSCSTHVEAAARVALREFEERGGTVRDPTEDNTRAC